MRRTPTSTPRLDDRPIGGLGIHIVRAMMDEIDYQRVDGRNLLTLVKRLDAS
uniref:ATP-binding protein n=1 Tax=Jiella pelagia TaxID=2986949 RepID=UPI0038B2A298